LINNNILIKKSKIFFRQTWVEIDKSDFHFNLKSIKKHIAKNIKIMVVLKNNAYGHGGVIIAKEAQKSSIQWIAVSSLEEGIELRDAGIKTNILILEKIFPSSNFQVAVAHSLTVTISTMLDFIALEKLAIRLNKKIDFHLKIDTGMGRIGIQPDLSYSLLNEISKINVVNMIGIYTHYSVADIDPLYTKLQFNIFIKIVKFARLKLKLKFIAHSANSASFIKNKMTHLDMIRPGSVIYGMNPFKQMYNSLKFKPVLSWKTKIIFLKKVPSGFCVSYGRTFVTNKLSVIATIPVGYGDGYNRLLSNKAYVLVRGKRCQILGKITMNSTMIDVTGIKGICIGDEVVLIGIQNKEQIKVEELAKIQDTINNEITSSISSNIPRIIV
jgi:alanine racemase